MAAIKKSDATERVPPYNVIENKIIASPLRGKAILQNIIKPARTGQWYTILKSRGAGFSSSPSMRSLVKRFLHCMQR